MNKEKQSTFFKGSSINFEEAFHPDREADFIGKSGFKFWFTENGIYREASVWGDIRVPQKHCKTMYKEYNVWHLNPHLGVNETQNWVLPENQYTHVDCEGNQLFKCGFSKWENVHIH